MVDKQKVEQAIRLLLEGIGEDITREGLIDTPDRIARMCEEIYGGLDQEAHHFGIYPGGLERFPQICFRFINREKGGSSSPDR